MDFEKVLSAALKELEIADHLLNVSYPILKDKKIFRSAVRHMVTNSRLIIRAILNSEYENKRIQIVPSDDDYALEIFIENYSSKFEMNDELKKALKELSFVDKLIKDEKSSDFQRDDRYYIMSGEYKVFGLEPKTIKKYLDLLKEFNLKIKKDMARKNGF